MQDSPVSWSAQWIASPVIGAPGYKQIRFKPRPGGTITWAEAKLRTPQGDAAIRWELKNGKLALNLTVPEGSEAELSLPPGWKAEERVLKAGTYRINATAA